MSTVETFKNEEIRAEQRYFSQLKTVVETAFYGNNAVEIESIKQAYHLAKEAPNTIVMDQHVQFAEELGLPSQAHILVQNGGAVVGRTAAARRIVGQNPKEDEVLEKIIREAAYQGSLKPFYRATTIVGLDEEFMVKAHITMPQTQINNLYSWLLNFQIYNAQYSKRYKNSVTYDENDIYVFFDPDWRHPDYPNGLAYFDPEHNVAMILGLNYFGEIKKGTLTLAWGTAARNGFCSCHGGLKIFRDVNERDYVASFFGLSGSGKSTLTHAKHNDKYNIEVLHDDAFVINLITGSSVALEPSYFDKTNDYPVGHREQNYFMTVQNVGVTRNKEGERVLVTQDIRNGNGRTVKSRYATPNRVDHITEPINAIYWIMKDDSLPPVLKINDPVLAATFGCTLATKRSSAENIIGKQDELVIEPYANPFRVYPLVEDYEKFKALFEERQVDCYIVNTGFFLNDKVKPHHTLGIIESNVEQTATYMDFPLLKDVQYAEIEDFHIPVEDNAYRVKLRNRMQRRLDYVLEHNKLYPNHPLPAEVISSLQELIREIASTLDA
ncbi:phosphoenolpyruvate carboxykinase (ATP) [Atopobacter phocae]|uniref:phosphoenolpyruvate carboxykinase (ATP) n=1 Tax=Atopobacter phocae TaxID=136492 RepID=UPI00046F96FC|nr:phosphoenolpyruvate carboxykinase (ATP) [Atopobacter phocae]